MTEQYTGTVFYLHGSVFEDAGEDLDKDLGYEETPPIQLLHNSMLANARNKDKIGHHITYTTREMWEELKEKDCAEHYGGILPLGEDIAKPELADYGHDDTNHNLIRAANNKNAEVVGDVKIVVSNVEARNITEKIEEDDYPVEVVTPEEALEELRGDIMPQLN